MQRGDDIDNQRRPPQNPPRRLSFPVRILGYVLDDPHRIAGADYVNGEATDTIIDLKQQTLMYRVRLESGIYTQINVGFVDYVFTAGDDKIEKDDDDDHAADIVDSQDNAVEGREFSCEELEDGNEEFEWPPEMQFCHPENFAWSAHRDGLLLNYNWSDLHDEINASSDAAATPLRGLVDYDSELHDCITNNSRGRRQRWRRGGSVEPRSGVDVQRQRAVDHASGSGLGGLHFLEAWNRA